MHEEIATLCSLAHRHTDSAKSFARNTGEARVTPLAPFHSVFVIPCEKLVASIAGKDDLDMLGCQTGNEESRNGRSIAKWLIEVPHQILEKVGNVRSNNMLVMIRRKSARDCTGIRQLVERALVKADGKRFHRAIGATHHVCDNRARIDPAAQEIGRASCR